MNISIIVDKPMSSQARHFYLDSLNTDISNIKILIVPKLTRAAHIKEWLETNTTNDHIYICCVASINKYVTIKGMQPGYVFNTDYGTWIPFPNIGTSYYDPEKIKGVLSRCKDAFNKYIEGSYIEPGSNIIHKGTYIYPHQLKALKSTLQGLQSYSVLSCDIETYSLKHYSAGLGSIAFAWSKHEGISIYVNNDPEVIKLLKEFFEDYQGTLRYHNISFDVTVLIYVMFMSNLLDQRGLLYGLEVMLKNWDCTQLITYLATNSCSGNHLGLKYQAQEFAGDYAVENINDITQIPVDKLLEYNLIDCLSTNYVYEKHWNTLVQDDQLDVYLNIFKPAIKDIIQMQLTGAPININRVNEVADELYKLEQDLLLKIQGSQVIKNFIDVLNQDWVEMKNNTLKVKRVTIDDANEEFNPNSNTQLGRLIEWLNLPVLKKTPTGSIKVGKKELDQYKVLVKEKDLQSLFEWLCDLKDVVKINTSFIPALKDSVPAEDGWHYIFSNFRLGGTISGRIAAREINLQQIPNNSKFGSLIKSCFQAPPNKVLVGLDFNALEARIDALVTRDPNKQKVYLDGYDSHCLNAYAYFKDKMPLIKQGEQGERFYKLSYGKDTSYLKGTETVFYKGKEYTAEELHSLLTS